MDTNDASKYFAYNDTKIIRFFTGTYEGKFGYIDPTRRAPAGKVPVIVSLANGVRKKTAVSIWSFAIPHPEKPRNFAEAAVMQKLNFEKELKLLVEKCVQMGFMKTDASSNSLLDLFYAEMEIAQEKNKHAGAIEYND